MLAVQWIGGCDVGVVACGWQWWYGGGGWR